MLHSRKAVLVVDPDAGFRDAVAARLRAGFKPLRAASGEAALQAMEKERVDVVVVNADLPGITGFDLLRVVRENYPQVDVIMHSETARLDTAIEAMRLGAFHYVSKTQGVDEVETLVARACEQQAIEHDYRASQEFARGDREFIVGTSRTAREVVEVATKVAPLPATVLILGESGTGKEMLARFIHKQSPQANGPFVAVNLAAIPRELVESTLFGHEKGSFTGAIRQQLGKFEIATGGTLFLDEVGDLRYDLQGKLLRALQEGEIERVGGTHPIQTDFRLIAATNVDLETAVKEQRFRGDLYYRLHVIPIRMPPLRARIEDLPLLAEYFLQKFNTKFRKRVQGIAESTLDVLSSYWWPGNIRELENLIERLVAVCDKDWITDEELPPELLVAKLDAATPGANRLEQALVTFERNFILRALEKERWAVSATAKALGVPLSTLKFKMDRLEIREIARKVRGR